MKEIKNNLSHLNAREEKDLITQKKIFQKISVLNLVYQTLTLY